jgi:hypothetical protein
MVKESASYWWRAVWLLFGFSACAGTPGNESGGLEPGTRSVAEASIHEPSFEAWSWSSPAGLVNSDAHLELGDFTGDGADDLIVRDAGGAIHLYRSTLLGFSLSDSWTSPPIPAADTVWFKDVSGDGRVDLIRRWSSQRSPADVGFVDVSLSDGIGFPVVSWFSTISMAYAEDTVYIADVSGEGRADYIRRWSSHRSPADVGFVDVSLSDGNGFPVYANWFSTISMANDQDTIYFADVNGDGKADYIRRWSSQPGPANEGYIDVSLSDGTGFPVYANWFSTISMANDQDTIYFADVNGDGKADYIRRWSSERSHLDEGYIDVSLSDGTGFPVYANWFSTVSMADAQDTVYFADVNGDKKADLIARVQSTGAIRVALSNGVGFPSWSWASAPGLLNADDELLIADVNGDTRTDIVVHRGATASDAGAILVGLGQVPPFRPQEQELWCWAATGEMIMNFWGVAVSQCEQANLMNGRSDCCGHGWEPAAWDPPPFNGQQSDWFNQCVQGQYCADEPPNLANWGLTSSRSDPPLSLDTVAGQFQGGNPRPMAVAVTHVSNQPCWHMFAVVGFRTRIVNGSMVNELLVYDPYPAKGDPLELGFEGRIYWITYEQYRDGFLNPLASIFPGAQNDQWVHRYTLYNIGGGGCECNGTGPGGVPVTVNCGESACGSDNIIYSCSSMGWSWTGQSCPTTCQCTGTGPGGVPVTVTCGQAACGSDSLEYTCSSTGWSWTGVPCL